jgi:hypothetical protein
MKMPFGQHKGKDLRNVPRPYLEWLKTRDIDDRLKEAIDSTIAEWDSMKRRPKKQKKAAPQTFVQKQPLPFDDVSARFRQFATRRVTITGDDVE